MSPTNDESRCEGGDNSGVGSLGLRAEIIERRDYERRQAKLILSELTGKSFLDMTRSPNGRFVAGADGTDDSRKPFALVDAQERRQLFATKLPRPRNPSASNEGRVLVESSAKGAELATDLMVFAPSGEPLWTLSLRANSGQSGISPSGTRVFCITYGSPHHIEHSNRLLLLDGLTGEVIWDRAFEHHSAVILQFEGEELVGTVVSPPSEGYRFYYDEGGEIGEEAERVLILRSVTRLGALVLSPRIRRALRASRLKEAKRLVGAVDLAELEVGVRAKFLGLHGEVHEACGEFVEAVAAYREALELDPGVRVKSRLKALERKLQ